MKPKSLREKFLDIFEVYYSEDTSNANLIKAIDRRGKIDSKKIVSVLLVLMDEIESLKSNKK